MAHAPAGRSRGAGDESGNGFLAILFDPFGGFFLGTAANFANHDDAVGIGILIEHFNDVEMRRADDRIPADADASALPDTAFGQLPDGLVGERATAGNHANVAFLMNVAGCNAYAAAAI